MAVTSVFNRAQCRGGLFTQLLPARRETVIAAIYRLTCYSLWLLVANEGEPNTYNNFGSETNGPSVDPESSVSIIDLSWDVQHATVRTATFTAFNGTTSIFEIKKL